ncbi:hypothetical protein NPIL_579721 [Nephila pilipes]|uniref:Uncharacterized protein n=1 Tax=Nephila pilipes TaxID=299642 RepID=A0A8X6P2R8_NEPPI|nr:hypothetical protein NPIL_579721 [Nephila pilipes]
MTANILPTLQHLAGVKVAVALYTNPELIAIEMKLNWFSWNFIHEQYAREKVSYCALPEMLQEKVVSIMKTLSSERNKWLLYHGEFFGYDIYKINNLWNSLGVIDRFETAKRLVECEDLKLKDRFKFACYYGIRKKVKQLWKKLSLKERKELENESHVFQHYSELAACDSLEPERSLMYIGEWIEWLKNGVGVRSPPFSYSRL